MTLTSVKLKNQCNYCKRSILRAFHIICAECPDCLLCGDCFSAGVEMGKHKNNHKYKVADCLEYPLFVKDWTINEELTLLEGIEKHGVGNWKTISEFIGTNKTTRNVEEHYWEGYMGVHGYCLPAQTLWKDQLHDTSSFCPEVKHEEQPSLEGVVEQDDEPPAEDLYRVGVTPGYKRGEPVRRDEGFQHLATSKASNKDKQELQEKLARLPGGDLPGFTPLRGDFDNEYENDADRMLADMEFALDEHPSERELKLQVVRIYNHKLEERNRRKQFVIERGLIDFKQQQQQDKRRTKEERDLVGRLRVFARFQSREEHEALVEGMLRAGRLRQQIELYKTYRAMGVRTLEQARQYEASKRIRERDLKARKHRDSAPYLFGAGAGGSQSELGEGEEGGNGNSKATTAAGTSRRRGRDSSSNLVDEAAGTSSTAGVGLGSRKRAALEESSGLWAQGRSATGVNQQETAQTAAALTRAPGGDLLSELELRFCAQVPMLPLHYLAAKDAIVREAYRNGSLTQEGVKRVLKFDADGTEKIYDFFVKELLINEPPPSRVKN